jgi:hypothetical protein
MLSESADGRLGEEPMIKRSIADRYEREDAALTDVAICVLAAQ